MITRRQFTSAVCATLLATPAAALARRRPDELVRVGFLGAADPVAYARQIEAVRAGLRDFGYIEGKNLRLELRWAEGNYRRLDELARELVASNPDVIVTHATPGTRAVMRATSSIPIVMATNGEAVAQGLVKSLARPGGNVTGSTFLQPELMAKRVELLKLAAPHISRVAVLVNPGNPTRDFLLREMERAVADFSVRLLPIDIRSPEDIEKVFFEIVAQGAEGVVLRDDAVLIATAKTVSTLALAHQLPTAGFKAFAVQGGLIGYGVDFIALFRRVGFFVDKIVKGAKPAEIPVEQATSFELVLNLRTAKSLGLTLPKRLLMRADRSIE